MEPAPVGPAHQTEIFACAGNLSAVASSEQIDAVPRLPAKCQKWSYAVQQTASFLSITAPARIFFAA
jgi:hypothetical protein